MDIKKCPAVILAVKRKHSVKGRTKILNVSTITIKFISAKGGPWGVKCTMARLKFLVLPITIDNSQALIARGTVMVACVVNARVCGSMAALFKTKIIMNTACVTSKELGFSFNIDLVSFIK